MSNFVSVESGLDEVRRNNFFWYGALSSFVWMCFHFTLVFFFLLQLESPLLVGIFLGLGNFVSFLVDSPVGVLQKYFHAKKLFVLSAIMMLIVSVIFLYFIHSSGSIDLKGSAEALVKFSSDAFLKFTTSFFNLILLLISVVLYGIIKEFSDVTSLSYIMNNADPSEYAELLSKNNIFSGLGALVGLLASGVILAFNAFIAVSILVVIVAIFIVFILKYFDNSKEVFKINVNMQDIKNLKVISAKQSLESVKEYAIAQIHRTDFAHIANNMKFVFLKPMEIRKNINWGEILETTIEDIRSFIMILFQPPYSHRLLILGVVLTFFGLWDTFVTSFLIDFLSEIIKQNQDNFLAKVMSAYVFIAVLAIPAYGAQVPLISLSKKIGAFPVIMAGVLISGLSILLFGAFTTFGIVLILGIVNSFGYAAAMPLSQGDFSDEYNQVYADKKKLTEIDSNASSAPLKMLLNLANVVGLIFGGALVFIVGYPGTFFVFGVFLIGVFVLSLVKRKEWKLSGQTDPAIPDVPAQETAQQA